MKQSRWVAPLLAASLLVAWTVTAAPVPVKTEETIKDRTTFIPHRKYAPLKDKMIGVLVSDVVAMMGQEGRGGPPDAMGFSAGGGSYRWIYVGVTEKPLINNLQVKIGEQGDRTKIYPSLSMANAQTVKQWNVAGPYALVEVEVNDGNGAPADESFVATKMTQLDGTKDFPLKLNDVIADVRKKYETYQAEQKTKFDTALDDAQKSALKDKKPTGPREKKDFFYITWLPESQRVRIHFRTTITDGHYEIVGGGIERDPPALPPGRRPPVRPPPPRFEGFRSGTTFGIEYGMAYEVTKSGNIDRTLILPVEPFKKDLPVPPGFGPRGPVEP
jgi:hypothetical protein